MESLALQAAGGLHVPSLLEAAEVQALCNVLDSQRSRQVLFGGQHQHSGLCKGLLAHQIVEGRTGGKIAARVVQAELVRGIDHENDTYGKVSLIRCKWEEVLKKCKTRSCDLWCSLSNEATSLGYSHPTL